MWIFHVFLGFASLNICKNLFFLISLNVKFAFKSLLAEKKYFVHFYIFWGP